jgi:hypothetical protein
MLFGMPVRRFHSMVATTFSPLTLRALTPSFQRHLLSINRSPKTVRCYLAAVASLASYDR